MNDTVISVLIAPLAATIVTFFLTRKATRAEARSKEIQNEKDELENDLKEIDIYKSIIRDLKLELEDRNKNQKELLDKMTLVLKQNVELLSKVNALEKDYESLNRNYNELQKQYKKLLINKNKQDV